MFRKKQTRTDIVKAKAAEQATALKEMVGPAAEQAYAAAAEKAVIARAVAADKAALARAAAAEKATEARNAAAKRVESEAPKLQDAVYGLTPQVDKAHDAIVDDVIPRLAQGIAALAAGAVAANATADLKDSTTEDVVEALKTGKVKKKRKGGKLLVVLGLAAIGTAAYLASKRNKAKVDPWAVPAADPYAGLAPSQPVHTSTSPAADTAPSAVDSLGSDVADTGDTLLDETTNTDPTTDVKND